MLRLAALALAAALCGTAAAAARARLEPEALEVGRVRDPAWLPQGKAARLAAMGQHQLLADVYWLRTVQYIGEMVLAKGDWRALHPLADLTTDLDPRFGYAYQVAGSNLAGLAHRYDEADAILQKGMRALPERWSLPWTFAVNKFLYQGDYATAAEYARRAAEVGRRPHLALLAANLALVNDDASEYASAEAVLLGALAQAEQAELRVDLEARLVKVRTYSALSRLERALAAHRHRFGWNPLFLEDLVERGLLDALPIDPSGGTFRYDRATGQVVSTVLGARKPLRLH